MTTIQHVFVLMLENRSFDHMLGFSGIVGYDPVERRTRPVNGPGGAGNEYQGQFYRAQPPGINPMPHDPGHEFPDVLEQLSGPGAQYPPHGAYPPVNSSGYIANYVHNFPGPGTRVNDPLSCLDPTQVPVICDLAQNFVVCDNWYSSMPGPTWPNRFFVHAASSGGLDHSPSSFDIGLWMAFGFPFQNGTIFDRLQRAQLPWRIYAGDLFPMTRALQNMTLPAYRANFYGYGSFASDLAAGNYVPAYTFIEPSYGNILDSTFTCGTSQHPMDDVTRGEWLIKCTYEAIRASAVWDTSMLIVTWDEHGGFYDHAQAGAATPPGDVWTVKGANEYGFTFAQLGTRVPAVVASPLIPANLIDGQPHDHTVVLATLESLFNLATLTARDRDAASLIPLVTLANPRQDAPMTLAQPAQGVPLPQCSPIGSCTSLTWFGSGGQSLLSAQEAELPLAGDQPGFVHAAVQTDLAFTRPEERALRVARAQHVTTRGEAAEYFDEVADRVRAATAARPPATTAALQATQAAPPAPGAPAAPPAPAQAARPAPPRPALAVRAGRVAGTWAGLLTGAEIGTAALPVPLVGSLVGAVVGAVLGSGIGGWMGALVDRAGEPRPHGSPPPSPPRPDDDGPWVPEGWTPKGPSPVPALPTAPQAQPVATLLPAAPIPAPAPDPADPDPGGQAPPPADGSPATAGSVQPPDSDSVPGIAAANPRRPGRPRGPRPAKVGPTPAVPDLTSPRTDTAEPVRPKPSTARRATKRHRESDDKE